MTEDRFQKRGVSRTLKSAVGSALVITANAACAQQPAYPEKTIRLIAIAGAGDFSWSPSGKAGAGGGRGGLSAGIG